MQNHAPPAFAIHASPLSELQGYHTATLLPNGKVLVAGGQSGSVFYGSVISSTELYDPGTGTWTATASMKTARSGHTATLLLNGKVLVVQGSAELYDPATGAWTLTSALATPRSVHTATLLPNGKVLVTGGQNNSPGLASAELYDPGTGTWTATASMKAARSFHTATLLPNGKVLVAGAENLNITSSSRAELYASITANLGHNPTSVPDCDPTAVGVVDACGATVSCAKVDTINGCTHARTLTYTAVDACNNSNTCTQVFVWTQDTPPVIACPPNLTAYACGNGTPVTYAKPTLIAGCATVTCVPPSGSQFLIGVTPVTCTATDAQGNSAQCLFLVTVQAGPPQYCQPIGIGIRGGSIAITVPGGFTNFTLQQTGNLNGTNTEWTEVPDATATTNADGSTSISIPTTGPMRMFRVVTNIIP